MGEKRLKSRVVNKHDIEANWSASDFIPMKGEIVVYDKDDALFKRERFKIGDGVTVVSELPFADVTADAATNTDTVPCRIGADGKLYVTPMLVDADLKTEGQAADAKATGDALDALNELVGEISVPDQIATAIKVTSVGGQTGDVMNPTFNVVTANKVIGAVYA